MKNHINRLTIQYSIALCLFFGVLLHPKVNAQNNTKSANQTSQPGTGQKSYNSKRSLIPQILFSGVLIQNQKQKQTWYIPSLFELFPANTIEGFATNLHLSFTQYLPGGRFYNLKPAVRYGWGNNRIQAQLAAQFYYKPSHKASVQLSGGRFVEQFNSKSTLQALGNTMSTFLSRENYLKLYERSYVALEHIAAPFKDFLLTTTISWNERSPLQNLPQYNEQNSEFTANDPVNNELTNTNFTKHQAVLWNAQLRWQAKHQYVRKRGKFKSISPYPAIAVIYSGALAEVAASDVSYQKIALRITEDFNTGKWGKGKFFIEAGNFIAKDSLSFIDFKHFNGKRTAYGAFRIDDFQLLDYYQYSTTDVYLQSHYQHLFAPLAIGRIKLHPVVSANYLHTPAGGDYWEIGGGLNKLLKFWRVDFYSSWRNQKHESIGVRFGVVID
ncbi:MAG TPA: hypothetical protein DCS93_21760 [Microscillaceae bacterium]|nr:hypothetical protein [Microscillaceae bacterium]